MYCRRAFFIMQARVGIGDLIEVIGGVHRDGAVVGQHCQVCLQVGAQVDFDDDVSACRMSVQQCRGDVLAAVVDDLVRTRSS